MEKDTIHPDDLIEKHSRLTSEQKPALKRLGLLTIRDLLYHYPVRHVGGGNASPIELAQDGERATIYGQVKTKYIYFTRSLSLRDKTTKW